MARHGFTLRFVFLTGGLLVWAAHFFLTYGLTALACARNGDGPGLWGPSSVTVMIAAATAVAVIFQTAILVAAWCGRGPGIVDERQASLRDFWSYTTVALAALSLVAVLWTGIPVLFVSPCG